MIIKSFNYQVRNWHLSDVLFGNLNLLVGKNAVGKSRTLNSLVQVARYIKGDLGNVLFGFKCSLVFELDEREEMVYSFSVDDANNVETEYLEKGGVVIVDRKGAEALIKGDSFNPPTDKLCVQSQRDTSNYPEFETIMKWAGQIKGFSFSDLSQSSYAAIPSMFNERITVSDIFDVIDGGKKAFVVDKLRELDYDIESLDAISISEKYSIITLSEKGVSMPLLTHTMSNGMLRVFCIFLYLAYLSSEDGPRTLFIDDLGEGLDFSRSKKLSKTIFDYCEEHGIQLIVTSNDNFLMNAVDLRHWIILQREGEIITAISEKTHPLMFLKFKRMGLNNFDMFSTDYVSKYLKSQEE